MLTFGLLAGQFLILVFGFYYVISSFYFSRDLDLLVPLPVTPTQVLLSKFTVILVNEYVTAAPLVLPMLIQYGLLAKAGPRYWIEAVLVYLLLPVIPLSIVALLAVGLMRAVNVGRKKDFLIVAGSLILMTAALGGQYWLSRSMGSSVNSEAIDPLVRLARRFCPDHRSPLPAERLGHPGPGLRLPGPRTGGRRALPGLVPRLVRRHHGFFAAACSTGA